MRVTEDLYCITSVNHIGVAQDLVDAGQHPLASYLAGLAVECMLRAYSHRIAGEFDARHDLRLWYKRSKFDVFVPASRSDEISLAIALVIGQWNNSQRYYSLELLRAEWKSAGLSRSIRGDFVKECTHQLVDAAWTIVSLGEEQWKNSFTKSKSY